MAVYRLGCRLLGLTSTLYGVALLVLFGAGAALSAGILLVFALVCGIRLLRLRGWQ